MQAKNSDRKDAIAAGDYLDPWTSSKEFLSRLSTKLVNDEQSKRISKSITDIKNSVFNKKADLFAKSTDMVSATNAIKGICSKEVSPFYESLLYGRIPLLGQKIKLLLSGNYEGNRIYIDTETWPMSKKKSNRLWRTRCKNFVSIGWLIEV